MSHSPVVEGAFSDLYHSTDAELRAKRGAFVASLIGEDLLLKFQESALEVADETLTPEQRADVWLRLINTGRLTADEVHQFAGALVRANEIVYASLAQRILRGAEIALDADEARRILDLDPENWNYELLYGTALLFSVPKQPKTAQEYLLLALDRCPETERAGILSFLAMAAMFSGDLSAARSWIRQTVAVDPLQTRSRRVEFMVGFYAGAPWPEVWDKDFEWRWPGYAG